MQQRYKNAFQAYLYGVRQVGGITATYRQVYEWLKKNGTGEGYRLPAFETWKNYVCVAKSLQLGESQAA